MLRRARTRGERDDVDPTDLFDVITASFHPTHEGQYQMYLALAPTLPAGWD